VFFAVNYLHFEQAMKLGHHYEISYDRLTIRFILGLS